MKLECPKCGKVRNFRPATIAKLKTKVCRTCLDAEEKSKWVTKKCPHCGHEKLLPPAEASRRSGHCLHCPRHKPGGELPDTFDGGYLLGVVLGDGCLFKGKGPTGYFYGIKLEVTSEAFALRFKDHLEVVIGKKAWMTTSERDIKANEKIGMPATHIKTFIVGVTSREWYDILRPSKKDRNFDGILDKGEDFLRGLFQGILDSEGYANEKYIDISNKDLQFLNLVRDVLLSLGFPATIYGPYADAKGVAHLRTLPLFTKTV
jgi:predicted RNA-binding Zn-ribbon protein involved in translation (DUF1610 family)